MTDPFALAGAVLIAFALGVAAGRAGAPRPVPAAAPEPAESQRKRAKSRAGAQQIFRLSEGQRPDFGEPAIFEAGHAMGVDPEDGARWIGRKIADNLGWAFAITYTDGEGLTENRRIDVDGVYVRDGYVGPRYVTAFCHTRNERRTFRTDRVRAWACAEGEGVHEFVAHPPFADAIAERLLRQQD